MLNLSVHDFLVFFLRCDTKLSMLCSVCVLTQIWLFTCLLQPCIHFRYSYNCMCSFSNCLSNWSLFEIHILQGSLQFFTCLLQNRFSNFHVILLNCFLPFQPLCFALQVFLSYSKLLFLVFFVVLSLSVDLATCRPLLFPSPPFLDA